MTEGADNDMQLDLVNRVGIVTGGASGIGLAISKALADSGVRVAILDLDGGAAKAAADEVVGSIPILADVSRRADVEKAFAAVEEELGPLDILVNNAGYARGATLERRMQALEPEGEITETPSSSRRYDVTVNVTDEEWRHMLAVHLDGTFFCTRAALTSMVRRGRGAIVNIASVAGVEGSTGAPHYSAAKGGILAFTRSVAKEVIAQGIRVNAVAPGYIETPMASAMTGAMRQMALARTPLGRLGTAEEVAAAVLFLASDQASFFVGQSISPNGGIFTA